MRQLALVTSSAPPLRRGWAGVPSGAREGARFLRAGPRWPELPPAPAPGGGTAIVELIKEAKHLPVAVPQLLGCDGRRGRPIPQLVHPGRASGSTSRHHTHLGIRRFVVDLLIRVTRFLRLAGIVGAEYSSWVYGRSTSSQQGAADGSSTANRPEYRRVVQEATTKPTHWVSLLRTVGSRNRRTARPERRERDSISGAPWCPRRSTMGRYMRSAACSRARAAGTASPARWI